MRAVLFLTRLGAGWHARLSREQDRDAVIAVVEDARAAQEREAERLRDKLSGFGKTLTPLAPRTNGEASASASNGGGTLRDYANEDEDGRGRDDLVDSAEVGLATGCSPLNEACFLLRSNRIDMQLFAPSVGRKKQVRTLLRW